MKHIFPLLFCIPILLSAQEHIPVHPQLQGDSLISQIQLTHTTDSVLDYSMARDTLFKNIDARRDTLYGIYTQHGVYLPPGEDPTTAAFKEGAADGINTEHAWPRSKGARFGNAESDMHHLFPSRTPVNSVRANLPFRDVPDPQTNTWYYKDFSVNTIPSSNIDAYSELGNNYFEPRESVKGDIARAMFYFYTIYRTEAEQADAEFFNLQRESFCEWHLMDPVDSIEWERTLGIAAYQDGIPNPFILDCTLAHRAYCTDYEECTPETSNEYALNESPELKVYPNPASSIIHVKLLNSELNSDHELILFNARGEVVRQFNGVQNTQWSVYLNELPAGMYYLHCRTGTPNAPSILTQKLIILPE